MSTYLLIGDAHAKPNTDLARFHWLGRFIVDRKPDVIIDMGDWEDMPSLCKYDKGTKSYEGRRYKLDVAAAWRAREIVDSHISHYNDRQRRLKERLYKPTLYSLGCNHFEKRVRRTIEYSPELEGMISDNDHRCADWGWERIDFLEPLVSDGFVFSHYFQGNGTANPIGMGKFPANILLREKHCSSVMGHNHLLDVSTTLDGRDNRLWAFSTGCFFDQWEDYAGRNNLTWWRGLVVLNDVKDGDISGYETISLQKLQQQYADPRDTTIVTFDNYNSY